MPYMIYQQYSTAVKEAYAGHESIEALYLQAKSCREWLASLEIDARLRDPMVEPVAWVEEAFKDLLSRMEKG